MVPDWAKHDTIYYTDTIPVDLSKIYEQSSEITYLAFKINIWNEYPAVCKVQMYFTDTASTTLYSFWENKSLTIAKGNPISSTVSNPTFSGSTVTFDVAQIERLRTVENLIFHIKIGLNSTKVESFQNFKNYKLTCQLGARVDFILNNLK